MALLSVLIILAVWAIYGIIKGIEPEHPPIDNMEEHLNTLLSLPNQKARRRFLKKEAWDYRFSKFK